MSVPSVQADWSQAVTPPRTRKGQGKPKRDATAGNRWAVVFSACTFIRAWDAAQHDKVMEAGKELESLRRAVLRYQEAVKQDEKGRRIT